ncbi:MAG: uroporphyrinogen-III synthase [Thiobacillaceae bacterium]|jgi:uroporphyrinogen-III synthase|nr:uroporphyrinogen-III synthase [Thiobacillaceae bacterium]
MNARAPLAGIGVLVTRPREQAERFMARVVELGGRAWWLPTLEIQPPEDPAALDAALSELASFDWAIFISPTAVAWSWPGIVARGGLPAGLRVAAVGQGSARELLARGVDKVLAPAGDRSDSESLLALPELSDLARQRVVIFRGEGGRELLADALAARGARVEHAVCYRRARPQADAGPVLAALERGEIGAVTVFSRDSLDGLVGLLGEAGVARLRRIPLFAPHPRIAEHARCMAILQTIATPSGEEGVLTALVEHFAHVRARQPETDR